MTDNIEQAEIINEEPLQDDNQSPCNSYPEGWKQATRTLWNGAIFTGILILLCAILIFFFPKEEIETIHIGAAPVADTLIVGDTLAPATPAMQPQDVTRTIATSKSMNIGIGTLLVYFLILTLTALGAINTYQKGLIKFAAMFGKDGARGLDVMRWSFMLAMMGVLFHFFIFWLPITDPETKRETSTLILGNSILILSAIMSIVGSLMLATANGCPDPSRKGALLKIVASLILLSGAFVAPFAVSGSGWSRIVELIILVAGSILFLVSWHKIVKIES